MADIELVIKIPEEKYQGILNMAEEILDASTFCSPRYLYKAVLNGTPFPKGHGRLIDADRLRSMYSINQANFNTVVGIQKWIDNAPTIIPAESEE